MRWRATMSSKGLRIRSAGAVARDVNASRTSISKVIFIGANRTRRALLVTLFPNVTAPASARAGRQSSGRPKIWR